MATTLNDYQIWCTTNNQYYDIWGTTEPTLCPYHHDTNIDTTKTYISSQVSQNITQIQQEVTPTDGGYQVSTLIINCPASSSTVANWSYPCPVNVVGALFVTGDEHENDSLDVTVAPNTIVGALTSNATTGQTVFNVSGTVTTYTKNGHRITITDFVHSDSLGICLNHDSISGTITTSLPATHGFSAGSPTYVMITPVFANNITFGKGTRYKLGNNVLKTAYLPANKIVSFKYTNNGITDKSLKLNFQYLV